MAFLLSLPWNWGTSEILVVIAAITYFYFWCTRKPPNFPPGPRRLPLLGNLHQLGSEPHKAFMKMQKEYGDMFSIYFGNNPAVIINDPKLLREMFSEAVFSGRANFLKPFQDRTGGIPRGVIFTHEATWVEQRRFALKTLRDFGFGKKSMESMVQQEATELIETFRKMAGKPIQTQNKFNAAVLNALWTLITGNRYSHDDPMLHDLIKRLTSTVSSSRAAGAILFFPFLYKLRVWFPFLFGPSAAQRTETQKKTLAFIRQHIKEHQDTYQAHAVPRDFIDVYLGEMEKAAVGSSFDGEEGIKNLVYTMLDLFIAGAETTSTTLTWMFLLLALNPQPQEKLFEEIDSVVGKSRLPSLHDRPNMPYTEAVIMEVMRFSAMVPTGVFHSVLEDTTFKGYFLPKNTIIVSNLYACMKSPAIWGDPDTFRPERFLAGDAKSVVRHEALLPFSTGKRVCLGESLAKDELFLFTACLFQRFRVTPDPNGPPPTMDYHMATVLIPMPHNLVVHDRQDEE
ncbi:cytochrome P450 2J3 [Folsomia candida]|uniref:cytochrome P450 2J3 n=1 Tax=Folsomia candida TaxID=158441 RepID=UPI000B903ECF|nr:cytochrome P450 2J3 [Folsomia candida]XP_035710232.1 cytochrome P450 2J3 [Folsomia candida]